MMGAETIVDRTGCAAHRHGTISAYRCGCRCPDGRTAWARYNYERKHGLAVPRLIDGTPTATRLRILAALGYDWRTLTRAAMYSHPKQITDLAFRRNPIVQRRTNDHIATVFNHLVSEPLPHGYAAGRAIDNARRASWGIVDIEAVNRALVGASVTLTPLERAAVIYIGIARGHLTSAIAVAARTNTRTVRAAR